VPDDRSEELRVAGWLANMVAFRSDYYTAYIAVMGVRANGTIVETAESGQYLVVLDRSNVASGTGQARIVGLRRIK